jgi:4-hydroxy-tetrahydrodipicolinate synthase
MSAIGRHVSKLSGYAPALPTPFADVGDIDAAAFERLCDLQIAHGATALVVCGTTGEAPTLSPGEHRHLIRMAVAISRGRIPVIAGAGANATAHAIELTRDAEAVGADAILSVVPYYNKPTQAGMAEHFRAVADATDLPIILHDIPSRTVRGLADETLARLAQSPQFIGLRDGAGDVTRPLRLRSLLRPGFRLMCGDDAAALAFLLYGGDGCISATSAILPALCGELAAHCRHGRLPAARGIADRLAPLTTAVCRNTPAAPKYALSLLGLMSPRVRLPMVELCEAEKAEIAQAIAAIGDGAERRRLELGKR